MPLASESEYLTIGGTVIVGTAACLCTNMFVLYGHAQRGDDRLVPGSAGVIPNPRRLTAVTHVLELVFFGDYDSNGAATADTHLGLRANIAEVAAVAQPVTSGDGARAVVWTRPDGSTASADCHVGPLQIGAGTYATARATLDLNVPTGRFT